MNLGTLLIVGLILLAIFALNGGGSSGKRRNRHEAKVEDEELADGSPEVTVADVGTSQVAKVLSYTEEDYGKFSAYEKNVLVIRDIVGSGAKDLVMLNTAGDGILRFIFRNEKGQRTCPDKDPYLAMGVMEGIIGAPEKFVEEGYGNIRYDCPLPKDEKGYFFNFKEFFEERGGEDFNFCFLRIKYEIEGRSYVGVTAVNYSPIEKTSE